MPARARRVRIGRFGGGRGVGFGDGIGYARKS